MVPVLPTDVGDVINSFFSPSPCDPLGNPVRDAFRISPEFHAFHCARLGSTHR